MNRSSNLRACLAVAVTALFSTVLTANEAKDHWAFQPIRRPALPPSFFGNPIDAFLSVELKKRGLKPTAPAPRSLLLRRVYFDLIGLPPTRSELEAFLRDDSPVAYERVVERLLASPQHGERWGRHWMDVWRYSDWFGNEGKGRITNGLRHLWHWRDWIVSSLNSGKGYDRMILEMLAGDEIAPSDPDILSATGFLVRNRYRLDRNVPMMASVEHTGRAFLGLTFDCARCHEHKYDPISHEDYYAFRAFFEPMGFRTDRLPGQADILVNGLPRVYDADLEVTTYLFEKGDERRPLKKKPLTARVPTFFAAKLDLAEVTIPAEEANPFLKDWVGREEIDRLQAEIKRLEKVHKKKPDDRLTTRLLETARAQIEVTQLIVEADRRKVSGDTSMALEAGKAQHLFNVAQTRENIVRAEIKAADFRERLKTDPSRKAQLVAAEKEVAKYEKELAKLEKTKPTASYQPLAEVYPAKSSGRRTALARWLISRDNPLTARVAVNHIWMRHFGEPLVPTVFDFGRAGKPPTHPELLDWLAAEFMESGWDMKRLHRLIVTSAAYGRTSSNADHAGNRKLDPENQFLWRMNPRRMEAEVVRDSLLHLSGDLDRVLGGPEIAVKEADRNPRRSMYFKHSGVDTVEMLSEFDCASVTECYRRRESVLPQQALTMANSPLARRSARLIASRIKEPFIQTAFMTVLARRPSKQEQASCERFLTEQTNRFTQKLTNFTGGPKVSPAPAKEPKQRARENLVHVLLNHNDYVTIR